MPADPEAHEVALSPWKGLASNQRIDPRFFQAADNCQVLQPGLLSCRLGLKPVTFDSISTIASSRQVFFPPSFARDRFGWLYIFDGVMRGLVWDGIAALAWDVGITAPTSGPGVAVAAGGNATEGPYSVAFRYKTSDPTPVYSSFSPVTTVQANTGSQFSYTSLTASSETRVTYKEVWRTTSGQATTFYLDQVIANATTTGSSTTSDATFKSTAISDLTTAQKILNDDGSLNARRQVPPPTHKPYVAFFQDRMWLGGYVAYNSGTVATNANTTITGTSTSWQSGASSSFIGRYIWIDGETAPKKITAVASATSLTIDSAAATTASGKSYYIAPSPIERNNLYFCVDDRTEILTKRGWLRHEDLTADDEALSLDPLDDSIVWAPIKSINRQRFNGELNRWKSQMFDALTTDDHRWLAQGCGIIGGHHTLRPKFDDATHFTTTKQAQAMTAKRIVVGGGKPVSSEIEVYSDELVELVGWYVTEGTDTDGTSCMVSQSEAANPQYCERIDGLALHFRERGATATACKAHDSGWGPIRQWYFGKGVGEHLRAAAPGKALTHEFLLSLSARQLKILYETLMDGDGHRHQGRPGSSNKTDIFSQKDMGRIDAFQMLCSMLGKRSSKHGYWVPKYEYEMQSVTAFRRRRATVCKMSRTREAYDGVVWCPTTSTGTWMARRNGVTYWTGNSEADEPESMSATNVIAVQENTGDDDEITGLMPAGAYLYVLKNRHIYRLEYVAQPRIDVGISQVTKRGCVNNRSWTKIDDVAYLMDQQGIYRFSGSQAEQISEPIQDLFRDGTIDWSVSKWFFAESDLTEQVVRFHVSYAADSSTRPRRWLEYNIRNETWQTGSYPGELGGACQCNISGRLRTLVGGENDYTYLMGSGYCDHVTSATTGTAASATSTTLVVDAGTTLTAAMVGAPLVITAGTGKAQVRKITAINNTTHTISVAAWTTTPDATSTYAIGGIPWNMKTGWLEFVYDDRDYPRAIDIQYVPTSGASSLDIRRYYDLATTPDNNTWPSDSGGYITLTADDPDAVLDLNTSSSSLGANIGWDSLNLQGRLSAAGLSPRQLAVELRGTQHTYPIQVTEVNIAGVEVD